MDQNETDTSSVSHVGYLTHQILGQYQKALRKQVPKTECRTDRQTDSVTPNS